jgi:phosphatidylglycerol:prolipoprotein diacylglycerol transferase
MGLEGIGISVDPVFLRVGILEIRWYGLIVALALLAGFFVLERQARERQIPAAELSKLYPWMLIAGLLGARLFHVVDQWEFYLREPLMILNLHRGGLAIWGGVIGGAATSIILFRVKRLPLGPLADSAAPAILIGQMIGRIACIITGDAYGGRTGLPWGFVYTHPGSSIPESLRGVPTHPYPLYEILWNGAVLATLLLLKRRTVSDGRLFCTYLALYSAGRFFLSYVRQEKAVLFGLQQAQVLALLVLILSVATYLFLHWREKVSAGTRPETAY